MAAAPAGAEANASALPDLRQQVKLVENKVIKMQSAMNQTNIALGDDVSRMHDRMAALEQTIRDVLVAAAAQPDAPDWARGVSNEVLAQEQAGGSGGWAPGL